MEEERTHRIPVDLEDGAGTIDIFVTITGTTPLQEATNDGDSSANVALETIPTRLTKEELDHYVSPDETKKAKKNFEIRLEILLDAAIVQSGFRRRKIRNQK